MEALSEEVVAAVRERAASVVDTLAGWVGISSYSRDVAGCNDMAAALDQAFSLPGMTGHRRSGNGVGDHIWWTSDAARDQPYALLVGHHDTVFPKGEFDMWDVQGDIARGPGVLDMKGGIAVVHAALSALADLGRLSQIPVVLVSVSDEEIGSTDSESLLRELGERAAFGLVFEAGRVADKIITQRKGTGRVRVSARGKAAHAGNHHADGINAIAALADFILQAQKLTDYAKGVTVNTGLCRGGTASNTVPDAATCDIDFRFIDNDDGLSVVEAMHSCAQAVGERHGSSITVVGGIRRPPLVRTPGSVALYQAYAKCAGRFGLGTAECELLGGGSDGNNLAANGVSVIDGLGPRGLGFHTTDEFIELSSLEIKAQALAALLLDFCFGDCPEF